MLIATQTHIQTSPKYWGTCGGIDGGVFGAGFERGLGLEARWGCVEVQTRRASERSGRYARVETR